MNIIKKIKIQMKQGQFQNVLQHLHLLLLQKSQQPQHVMMLEKG